MSLEPYIQLSRNMTLSQMIEASAENFNNTEWLLSGGLDELNIRRINAEKIFTGTLDAGKVTIYAKDGSYFYSIDKNGIVANNGTTDTLKFDLATGLLTIVSALIQSATGFPRVELNSLTTLISAYSDANNHVDIAPTYGGSPAIVWTAAGNPGVASIGTSAAVTSFVSSAQMLIQSSGNLNLAPSGNIVINNQTGQTTSIGYVKNVVAGAPIFGSMNFTKGLLTSFT